MSVPPTIAIVGAGIAGLAAAVRLRGMGAHVRVVDPGPSGGKARTVAEDGWRREVGPHSFTARAEAIFELAGELRLSDRILRLGKAAGARYLVRGGQLCKAGPFALGLGELWGLTRGLFRRGPVPVGMSVRAFLAARFGESFADGPGDALMTGIWAAAPAEVEMETAFPALTAAIRAHGTVFAALRSLPRRRRTGSYGFAEGMGILGDTARSLLGEATFHPHAALRIHPVGRGWTLETEGGPLAADAVIVATGARNAAHLLAELSPAAAEGLRGIRYAPLAVAHWLSPDAAFPHGFGWLAPYREGRLVLGTLFSSDLFPDRAPVGMRAFTSMFGGTRRADDAELDNQTISRRLRDEHRALTGRDVTLAGLEVVRHPRAVAVPQPGHAARVARIRGSLPESLAVAGAWCGAGAMNDAALAGQEEAARVWRLCTTRRPHAA